MISFFRESNPEILAFMVANGIESYTKLEEYYITRVIDIVSGLPTRNGSESLPLLLLFLIHLYYYYYYYCFSFTSIVSVSHLPLLLLLFLIYLYYYYYCFSFTHIFVVFIYDNYYNKIVLETV